MIKHVKRPQLWAALFFSGTILLSSSCQKPEEDLGIDLQRDQDLLGVNGLDTFSLKTYTVSEDSIRTDKLSPALVGAYIDPVFGFVKTSHNTVLRLSDTNPNFVPAGSSASDMVVDSIVLVLRYVVNPDVRVYGSNGPQRFQVFEMDELLAVDSIYYHNRVPSFLPENLVLDENNLISLAPNDSVFVDSVMLAPQLRIKLKPELGNRFIEASADGGLTEANFHEIFKGIRITVDPTQSNPYETGIINFEANQLSKITMYYRDTLGGDTLLYDFPMRTGVGKYGHYEHNFDVAQYELRDQVVNGNATQGQQDLFVQGVGGTKIRVEIPHLLNIRDSTDFAINQAILSIPVREGTTGEFNPPQQVLILGVDSDGRTFLLDDQIDSFAPTIPLDTVNNVYRINLTRHLQRVLLGEIENGYLEIVTASPGSTPNRVIINGPDYPNPESPVNNMKLSIIFTKF